MALINKVQKHHGEILCGNNQEGDCTEAGGTEEIPGEEHKQHCSSKYPGQDALEGGMRLKEGWVDDAKVQAGPQVLHGTVTGREFHPCTGTTANLAYQSTGEHWHWGDLSLHLVITITRAVWPVAVQWGQHSLTLIWLLLWSVRDNIKILGCYGFISTHIGTHPQAGMSTYIVRRP